jgi:hypothetical protein
VSTESEGPPSREVSYCALKLSFSQPFHDFVRSNGRRTGSIHQIVMFQLSSTPARNAVINIAELKRSVLTDEHGALALKTSPGYRRIRW